MRRKQRRQKKKPKLRQRHKHKPIKINLRITRMTLERILSQESRLMKILTF